MNPQISELLEFGSLPAACQGKLLLNTLNIDVLFRRVKGQTYNGRTGYLYQRHSVASGTIECCPLTHEARFSCFFGSIGQCEDAGSGLGVSFLVGHSPPSDFHELISVIPRRSTDFFVKIKSNAYL